MFERCGAMIIGYVAGRHRTVMKGGAKRASARIRRADKTIDQCSYSMSGTAAVAKVSSQICEVKTSQRITCGVVI